MRFSLTVLCVLLVVATALAVEIWTLRSVENELIRQKTGELNSEMQLQGERFLARVEELKQDTLFLSGLPSLRGVLEARFGKSGSKKLSEAQWRGQLEQAFLQVARAKPHYFQVRFIGVADDGLELARVDKMGDVGELRVAPVGELAPKGKRGYFREALAQPEGRVTLSKIQLNREHGEISQPPTPVLRASIPIFFQGEPVGVVVINQYVQHVLLELSTSADQDHNYYLTDELGNYLLHPDPERAFRFEYGEESLLQNEYREFADLFLRPQVFHRTVLQKGPRGSALTSLQLLNYNSRQDPRYVGLAVSEDLNDVLRAAERVRRQAYLIVAGMMLVGILAGGLYTRRLSAPFVKMSQILEHFDGKTTEQLPMGAPGEAGQLARAFSGMLKRIELQRGSLEWEAEERVRAEEAVRAILESVPETIVTIDDKGTILSFNQAGERIFGFKVEELLGENVKRLMPGEVAVRHDHFLDNYRRERGGRELTKLREMKGVRKNGELFPIELIVNEVKVGDTLNFVGVIRDISERKKAELQLREMNVSLARSNAELEQFAHVASHDLQSPLRTLASFSELLELEEGENLSEEGREYLHFIAQAATRMRSLVRDILAFSKVDSEQVLEEVDLNEVVGQCLDNLKSLVREREVRVRLEELPRVKGFRTLLPQLFQNLIENAIKYGPDDEPPEVAVAAEKVDGGWSLSVSDNGKGIPEEYQERIFQMFQRLDSRGASKGTGIGLALCKKIAERHGGTISVESEPGVGSTFTVFLPQTD